MALQSNTLPNRLARKPLAFAFVLLFAGLGGSLIAFSRAATEATITLSPATAEVSVGATVAVTIHADSNATPVNAVQAELKYDPAKLEYVSVSADTSAYGVAAPQETSPGRLLIPRGNISSLTGNQIVAVVNFKALQPGSVAVDVNQAASELLQSSDSSNILTRVAGATYTVADTTAPTAPGVAAPTGSTATSITLAWPAATDNVAITGYDIYRNGNKVGSSTSLTYTDSGLQPANSYTYAIVARDNAGNESPKSASVSLTTRPDTTAPGAVAGLTSGSQTPTSVNLTWSAATDDVAVTGYRILRNGVQVGTSPTPSYADSGLQPDTSYSYTIVAVDAAGNAAAPSEAGAIKTAKDSSAPTVPANLLSQATVLTGARLTWQAASDNVAVSGYRIYRDGVQIGTAAAPSFSDAGLTIGTTYRYTVSAIDAAGNESAQSAQTSVTLSLKPGDNNADDKVDLTDLSILLQNYGKPSPTRLKGDQNQDGTINLYDLSVLLANWGK